MSSKELNPFGVTLKASFFLFAVSIASLASHRAHAVKLDSYCVYLTSENKAIVQNAKKMLPIASVSKVFTTQWALHRLGPNYRFYTDFLITKDPKIAGAHRVHIKGTRDPYFDQINFHQMVSEFNRMGITHISLLTFDENLKFFSDPKGKFAATNEFKSGYPYPQDVEAMLKARSPFIGAAYNQSSRRLVAGGHKPLNPNPRMRIDKIEHLPTFAYKPPQRGVLIKTMGSAPLKDLLREMNRNSNNFAANQIFEYLGGPSEYHKYAEKQFKFKVGKDLSFINGAGSPHRIGDKYKLYNHATCSAVLKVMVWMKTYLSHPKTKLSMNSVLPVAGEGTKNTLDGSYNNDTLEKVLIGKTGTINQAVTFTGFANTKKGDVFFYYNMDTEIGGTDATYDIAKRWRESRVRIRSRITEMVDKLGGGIQADIKPLAF